MHLRFCPAANWLQALRTPHVAAVHTATELLLLAYYASEDLLSSTSAASFAGRTNCMSLPHFKLEIKRAAAPAGSAARSIAHAARSRQERSAAALRCGRGELCLHCPG